MDGSVRGRVNERPFSFGEARQAMHDASLQQLQHEQSLPSVAQDAALKDKTYRQLLAQTIVKLNAGGVAWTVAADVARGQDDVASARYERDVAAAVLEAMQQASWRLQANRRDAGRLCDWSMRRELAEGGA